MGLKTHVALRKYGWRTTPITSSDGLVWYDPTGELVKPEDWREDCPGDGVGAGLILLMVVAAVALLVNLLC